MKLAESKEEMSWMTSSANWFSVVCGVVEAMCQNGSDLFKREREEAVKRGLVDPQ